MEGLLSCAEGTVSGVEDAGIKNMGGRVNWSWCGQWKYGCPQNGSFTRSVNLTSEVIAKSSEASSSLHF